MTPFVNDFILLLYFYGKIFMFMYYIKVSYKINNKNAYMFN